MADRYLAATVYGRSEGVQREPSLVLDVQGFDYDRSQHSNGTTLVVKDVNAAVLRTLALQLLVQADLMRD